MSRIRRLCRRLSGAGLLLAGLVHPLDAQSADSLAPLPRVRALPTLGGELDERSRVAQLLGTETTTGYLLRSLSSRAVAGARDPSPLAWWIAAPEISTRWNSDLPYSLNEGSAWAGRGASAALLAGVVAGWGPLTLVLAPQLVYSQNGELPSSVLPDGMRDGRYPPWRVGRQSADLPLYRSGGPVARLDPGQTTLAATFGVGSFGVSTENQWWGPGIRNAIVMSSNAPGFPHLFARTAAPLRTPVGDFEARWILGRLQESESFDTVRANDVRALSALAVTFTPRSEPHLTLGLARSVWSAVDGTGAVAGRFADAVTRWKSPAAAEETGAEEAGDGGGFDQLLSVFGRWVFPGDGLEVYGEWAHRRPPRSSGQVADTPERTQGFTVGLQGAWKHGPAGAFRVQTELTTLEQNDPDNPVTSFYTSPSVVQGYTHRGQVIGAAIGPGASSQWLAADYLAPRWRIGAYGGRIRWDNDAYYDRPSAWPFLGHDVSLLGGLRGSVALPYLRLDADLGTEKRLNFLFQNYGVSWETSDSAVDVWNHRLRLTLTPLLVRPRAVSRAPAPVPPPPAPGETTPGPGAAADTAAVRPPLPAAVAPAPAYPVPAAPPTGADSLAPVPAARPATHQVSAGETFFGVARRYGISPAALRAANPGTEPDRIRPGQVLRIPPAGTPVAQAPPRRHTVSRGETLEGISRRYGVPQDAIRRANALRDDRILAGQELVIPLPR